MPRFTRKWSVLVCMIFIFASLTAATAEEKIDFRSFDPQDYRDILTGKFKDHTVGIHGFLYLPEGAGGKVPVVIIVPGSGGIKHWMQSTIGKPLNDAGMASFVIDSFSGRSVTETASDQTKVSMPASVIDGFTALKALEKHPAIDISRAGITGFSRGGITAMFTTEKRLKDVVLGPSIGFTAHAPIYPGCSTQWRSPKPTSASILFLLGGADDFTPARKCVDYSKRMKDHGAEANYIVYPGAHHAWMADFPVRQINAFQFADCELYVENDGVIVNEKTGVTTKQGWKAFVLDAVRTCAKRGPHVGENPEMRKKAVNDLVSFFRKAFRMQ